MSPITICLVGCGSAKLERPARAKDLYTGSLFVAARAYAEQCDDWRILSARYGLLNPDAKVAPYNMRLPSRELERRQWGLIAATGLGHEMRGIGYEVVVLAGDDYAEPVCRVLEERRIVCRRPLRGLGIGARLQWLRREAAAFGQNCAADVTERARRGDT
jgi:hypothetical protein